MVRRMLSDAVILNDKFLEQPFSTRFLYAALMLNTDDDGFVDNPKSVMRIVGATNDDLEGLKKNGWIYILENGVVLIKHFRLQNTIRSDRKKTTKFTKHLKRFELEPPGIYKETKQVTIDLEFKDE